MAGPGEELGCGIVLQAKDLAGQVLAHFRGDLDKTKQHASHSAHAIVNSFGDLKKHLAGAVIHGGLLGGAFKLSERADEFELAMKRVEVRTGATRHELEQIEKMAWDKALGKAGGLGGNVEDSAETMLALSERGMRAKEVLQSFGAASSMAAISMGKLGKGGAAELVADTLREFHMDASRSQEMVDKLALSMKLMGMPAEEAASAVRRVGIGVQAAGASFDDTLIALGLMRQKLPSVEMATMGVNRAFMMLGTQQTQKKLRAAFGVDVADKATGKMKPLIGILGEIEAKSAKMTDVKRQEKLAGIFGGRASGGMRTLIDALRDGIKDMTGKTLTGAAAVDYLRQQMEGSAGAAKKLHRSFTDGFTGAEAKALSGAVKSLGIAIGAPFDKAFMPIIRAARMAVQWLTATIKQIPEPVTDLITKVAVFAGVGLAAVSVLKLMTFVFPLVRAGIISMAGSFATLALTMGPLMLIGGAFYYAYKKNLGGFRDVVTSTVDKVSLAWSALTQLFGRGFIDEKTNKGLDENAGVLAWVREIYLWGMRLKNFFGHMWDSLTAGLKRAEPSFEKLSKTFGRLGSALGLKSLTNNVKENVTAFDQWGQRGDQVGEGLANIAEIVVDTLSWAIDNLLDLVASLTDENGSLRKTFDDTSKSVQQLSKDIHTVVDFFGLEKQATSDSKSSWGSWGSFVGSVIQVIAGEMRFIGGIASGVFGSVKEVIGAVVGVVEGLWNVFAGLANFIDGVFTADWTRAWKGLARVVFGIYGAIFKFVMGGIGAMASAIDGIGAAVGKNWNISGSVKAYTAESMGLVQDALGLGKAEVGWNAGQMPTVQGGTSDGGMSYQAPEGPMSMVPQFTSSPGFNQSNEETNRLLVEQNNLLRNMGGVGAVYLNGEKVGAAIQSAQRADQIASFAPAGLVSE